MSKGEYDGGGEKEQIPQKKLLEIDEDLIDVKQISNIRKRDAYNFNLEEEEFRIVVNEDSENKMFNPTYVFVYKDKKKRDDILNDIKHRLREELNILII